MSASVFNQNYFELFGLQPRFDIDIEQLRHEQQRLQSKYHPDRFAAADERRKRESVQVAALINQAFETLRDPVKRSRYLLQINGADLPDESTTTRDSGFLMEQIEYREAMESCRHCDQALNQCRQIEHRLETRQAELASEFVHRLENGDLGAALDSSRKMQFIQRVQHQVSELSYELEEV